MISSSQLTSSPQSSTQKNIHSFIRDTQFSDSSIKESSGASMSSEKPVEKSQQLNPIHEDTRFDDQLDEFGLDIPINNEPEMDGVEESPENDRKFQKNVKYLVNHDFDMANNQSMLPSGVNSIPNTFKNKSHPNAKTKPSLGQDSHVEESQVLPEKEEPIKTSTLSKSEIDNTPDWMPPELNERWNDEFHSSVKISKNPSMNFQFSNNSSVVHNSKNGLRTPMWKKVKGNYDQNKLQPQLHQIFNTSDKSHSMSSTLSTPYNSIKQNQLTKEQISELQNLLEQGKGKPDDYVMEFPPDVSPLKLWGNNYNTFTKGKLNDLLFNLAAPNFNLETNAPAPDHANMLENDNNLIENGHDLIEHGHENSVFNDKPKPELQKPIPKLKTKDLNTNLDQHYKQRANDLFDNIQKRGVILKPSNSRSISNNFNHINSTTHTATATSTPKLAKVNHNIDDINAYSSFSSGYDQDSTQFNNVNDENQYNYNQVTDSNEYTSLTESNSETHSNQSPSNSDIKSVSNSHLNSPSYSHQSPRHHSPHKFVSSPSHQFKESNSSYTFEQSESELDSSKPRTVPSQADETYRFELENRIKELESKLSSMDMYQNNMEALINENNNLRLEIHNHNSRKNAVQNFDEVSIDEYDMTNERSIEEIKLKTLSQLRLQHSNNPQMGTLKPDPKLPSYYGDMVLDEKNHRWVPREQKENFNSLDSIEDLLSNPGNSREMKRNSVIGEEPSEDEQEQTITNIKAKEVSFHLPHSEQVKSSPMAVDTTRVSQIDEVSFSQQQRKLVSIITDNLIGTKTHWNKVIDISLSGKDLFNIKDLKDFLPNLLKVDLSKNNLKFLKGLPNNLINLNLAANEVDNLTSFQDFLNLQHLNLSNNLLTKGHSLKYNIHLTKLNLSGNDLTGMDGLNNLTNLISLDVSQNKLCGEIDFKYFQFDNLQQLIVSENSIESLKNVGNLGNLRVLNANENKLINLDCNGKHLHLKKLLVKFNHLRGINLNDFPYLRTLRLDGNNFKSITGKPKYLEELSIKSQSTEFLQDFMNYSFDNLRTLDLSGNVDFFYHYNNRFLNVNKLTLSAINLRKLPDNFGQLFPNVTELNLNFNQIDNLSQLSQFKDLKRLYLVSNGLHKIEQIITNLINTRLSLKALDLRLNPLNVDFYPYLFNPQESELGPNTFYSKADTSNNLPIQLETLDDIENFAIHYESLNNHNNSDWEIRDKIFINSLKSTKAKRRINYQTLLINYFPNLKKLDGSLIDFDKRLEFENNLKHLS